MSAVLTRKLTDLQQSIEWAREDWHYPSDLPFEQDRRKQQLVVLNLQHAFQNLLDMANHLVLANKLGPPSNSRETFDLLEQAGLITADMKTRLKNCIGMRNILVHQYTTIDLNKVKEVVEEHLGEIVDAGKILFSLGLSSMVSQDIPDTGYNSIKPG